MHFPDIINQIVAIIIDFIGLHLLRLSENTSFIKIRLFQNFNLSHVFLSRFNLQHFNQGVDITKINFKFSKTFFNYVSLIFYLVFSQAEPGETIATTKEGNKIKIVVNILVKMKIKFYIFHRNFHIGLIYSLDLNDFFL